MEHRICIVFPVDSPCMLHFFKVRACADKAEGSGAASRVVVQSSVVDQLVASWNPLKASRVVPL